VHLTCSKEGFQHCSCVLCTPWRIIAAAEAAVVVGLPLVPGGAVAAALAATIAREQQRVVEEAATKMARLTGRERSLKRLCRELSLVVVTQAYIQQKLVLRGSTGAYIFHAWS
jgi:hypothetical protein